MIAHDLDADRPVILARAATALAGYRLPGGDAAAWLAPVPAVLIDQALGWGEPARIAAALFDLVGRFRYAHERAPSCLDGSDLANVPCGELADAALRAWSGCTLARLHLIQGAPSVAVRQTRLLMAELPAMPQALHARFAGLAESLTCEAMAVLARDLAEEVA